MALVAFALDMPLAAIDERDRSRAVTFARQLAMYLSNVAFGMSLGRVAIAFGRDRSTATHACNLVESRREDPRFDKWVEALERSAAAAPAPYAGEAA
jgi:chromosomal replication initiation ATPase DnaA